MTAAPATLTRLDVSGRETWRLDNGRLRADVLPGFGARVWELTDLARGVQWIWHNPKTPLAAPAPGAGYDDGWAGGWEELFPNDAPGTFDGRTLPDHGEWWSSRWEAAPGPDGTSVRMRLDARSVPALCEKTVSLAPGSRALEVRYRIRNEGDRPLRFMLKQHLAAAVRPGDRLELPGGAVRPVDLSFSTRLGAPGPTPWPEGRGPDGSAVDVSAAPAAGADREFVYVTDLPEGWAGVVRPDGARLRLSFDRDVFPHCWFFMDFGGWRGLYTAVVEPCTQWPKDMASAAAAGRVRVLAPGAVLETAVTAEVS